MTASIKWMSAEENENDLLFFRAFNNEKRKMSNIKKIP